MSELNLSFGPLPVGAKEQLSQEVEELKQNKEELEVRMSALKSQYEGRLLRLEKELRETQAHAEGREEAQDQIGVKVHYGLLPIITKNNPKVEKVDKTNKSAFTLNICD